MPEPNEYRTDPTQPTDQRKPRYLQGILLVFIAPVILVGRWLFKGAVGRAVLIATAVVALIGWTWSITVTYNHWWVFPAKYLSGVWPLPYLPLEELLFYPTGVMLIIGIYNSLSRRWTETLRRPWMARVLIYAGSAVFVALAVLYRNEKPYYLISQFIVYNLLAGILFEFVWRDIRPRALAVTTVALALVGFAWDYFAFKMDWWIYNAILGIKILDVPIDDMNFYLFAPAAGIFIYHLAARSFRRPADRG